MDLHNHPAWSRQQELGWWDALAFLSGWGWGSRERGQKTDLVAFFNDVWANGHDLVVEDVVLFYLAVDQRQVSPKALAA